MGSRYEVEVTVGSARDLKNVNWRNGDLKPYAVLWIDAGARCSTRVDLDGAGENPSWEEKVVVPLPPSSRLEDAVLYIDVVHANAADGVKPLVGSARLPLRDVIDHAGKVSKSLKLKRPSGRPQGKLDVRVAVREPSRYYDPNPGAYPAPAGYGSSQPAGPYGGGSSRDAYGGAYGAAAGATGGYGAYAATAPPSGYPGYGSTAPPPQAAAPYGSVQPPTQGAGYGSAVPAYGAGQAGYGSSAPAYGTTGVALDQSGGKKKKGMGMGAGLAVGAAAGVLGGLALAGGASYVEDKIEDGVAERVEEDMYGGGGYDYCGDDDY